MKNLIRKIDGKYYVFKVDKYGNMYDTMRHFKTLKEAQFFAKYY
jgi:hypothetical protein